MMARKIKYEKKRGFNLKGRAREWAENSRLLHNVLGHMDSGHFAAVKARIMRAVYKLMREAYDAGFEAGYKDGHKGGYEMGFTEGHGAGHLETIMEMGEDHAE